MMKFFGKWLTPEEEKLALPSRRTFFIGALSTLCLAAAPEGFTKLGNLYVPAEPVVSQLLEFCDIRSIVMQSKADKPIQVTIEQGPFVLQELVIPPKGCLNFWPGFLGVKSKELRFRASNDVDKLKVLALGQREDDRQYFRTEIEPVGRP